MSSCCTCVIKNKMASVFPLIVQKPTKTDSSKNERWRWTRSGLIFHSAGVNSLVGEEQLDVTWGSKLTLFIPAAPPPLTDRQHNNNRHWLSSAAGRVAEDTSLKDPPKHQQLDLVSLGGYRTLLLSLKAKWLIVMDKKRFEWEGLCEKRAWMQNKIHEKLWRIIKLDMEGKEIEKWAQQKIGKETIWCIDPYRLRWKQEIRNCAMLISMEIFFFYFSSIPPDPPPLERVGWSALSHRCSHIGPLLCPGILRLLERSWRLYHPATPPCPSPIIPYHTPTDLSEDGLISLRKLSLVSHFLFFCFHHSIIS